MARRTPPPPRAAFVASAQRVDLSDGKRAARVLSRRTDAQADAWDFFDTLSEVSFPAIWVGALMQKVHFYAATWDDKGNIVGVNAETSPLYGTALAVQAEYEMERLRGERGGQGELNRIGAMNLEVAGEYVLWGRAADPLAQPPRPEVWDVLSVREVEAKQVTEGEPAVYTVKRSPDDPGQQTGTDDTLIRVWQRHPAWGNRATSSIMSTLTDCDTLLTLSQEIRAQSKSRQGAGIFRVPAELNMKITADASDDENSPVPFDEALRVAMTTPIEEPDDASAVVPMIVSGPGEYLTPDKFGWTSLGRTTDASTDARMEKLTTRIARGIHLPVEVLMGHMGTTFANAEQISRDKFDEYLDPRCRTMADAYTTGFLLPQLRLAAAMGADYGLANVEDVFVWFDASAVVGSPDPTEDADALRSEGVISDAAYRRLKGIDEADAASPEERMYALAVAKGQLDTAQTAELLRAAGIQVDPPIAVSGVPNPEAPDATQATLAAVMGYMAALTDALVAPSRAAPAPQALAPVPVAQAPVAAPVAAPAAPVVTVLAAAGSAAARRATLGRRLVDIDRVLRARIAGAVELAVERMLERAGARVRTVKAIAASCPRTTPNYALTAALGPDLLESAGFTDRHFLDGAWDRLHDPFVAWTTQAAMQAYDAVAKAAARPLPAARRASYEQAARLRAEDGFRELVAGLDALADRLLYDGMSPGQVRVPMGIIRRALRVAGGWTGAMTVTAAADFQAGRVDGVASAADDRVVPSTPIGDVALGESLGGLLDEAGLGVEGYVWVYGPAGRTHPFAAHEDLDGVTFENFDDPALASAGEFADFYYPGDHDGCICDFEPTIIEADGTSRDDPPAARTLDATADTFTDEDAGATYAAATDARLGAAWREGFARPSDAARSALMDYTGSGKGANMLYARLNSTLRAGTLDQADARIVEVAQQVRSMMAPLPADITTFRGVDVLALRGAQVGDVVADGAFMSVSKSPSVAFDFTKPVPLGDEPLSVLMHITTPAGTRALDMNAALGAASRFAEEAELLMDTATRLRIDRIVEDVPAYGNAVLTHVYATVVP